MWSKPYEEEDQVNKENLRLKSAVEELSILNDLATAIASTQSLDEITNLIVKKCVKHLKSEQGSIQLVDEKDFVNPFHTMIRVMDSQKDVIPLRFDQHIANWMLADKKPILINESKSEEKISLHGEFDLKIKSLLSVPIPQHPFAKQKQVRLKSLSGQKFSGFEPDIPTRKALDKVLREHHVQVNHVMEFDNIETVKRAVEIDAGIAIVPQATVVQEVAKQTLTMLQLDEGQYVRPLAAIYKRSKVLSPALKQFLATLQAGPS